MDLRHGTSGMDEVATEHVHIHVAARIRPCSSTTPTQQCVHIDGKKSAIWLRNEDNEKKHFGFDTVLGADATQSEVFEKVAERIVDGCLDGYNGTILAYGQTNSGKTYTMQGADLNASEYSECKGIMPRSVEHLFERLETMRGESRFHHQVRCSFVELYNEQCFDLLAPEQQPRLRFANNCVHMDGVRVVECSEVADVLRLIELGVSNRRQAETTANRQSSRSHSILMIKVETEWYEQRGNSFNKTNDFLRNLGDDDEVLIRRSARLNLVDLAGAERLSYTKAEKLQVKEAIHINKSLTTLGRVIRSLSKNYTHIPYRDSILTQLLADSLGGNSKTAFIVTLHPDKKQFDTTILSLQFSQALRSIKHKVWVNQETLPSNNNTMKTNNTGFTVDEHLSISRALNEPELDSSVTAFETIEKLVNALDTIEKQKTSFVDNFRQLSLHEAEISRKLDAYKSGKNNSILVAGATPPSSRSKHAAISLPFPVQSDQILSPIISNSKERRRCTFNTNVTADFKDVNMISTINKETSPPRTPSPSSSSSEDNIQGNRRRTTPRVPTPYRRTRSAIPVLFDINNADNKAVSDQNESRQAISVDGSSKIDNRKSDFNNNHILSFDDGASDENQIPDELIQTANSANNSLVSIYDELIQTAANHTCANDSAEVTLLDSMDQSLFSESNEQESNKQVVGKEESNKQVQDMPDQSSTSITIDQLQYSISDDRVSFTISKSQTINIDFKSQSPESQVSVNHDSNSVTSKQQPPVSIEKSLPISIAVKEIPISGNRLCETIVLNSQSAHPASNQLDNSATSFSPDDQNCSGSREVSDGSNELSDESKQMLNELSNIDENELSTTSESEQEEEVKKTGIDPIIGTPKRTPMRLRRKSKVFRRLALYMAPQRRRTFTLFDREVLARSVRAHMDELLCKGVSTKEKHYVWSRISKAYTSKCPQQGTFTAEHAQYTWANLKRRVRKMSDDPVKSQKMNHVDHLILTIMNEANQKNKDTTSKPQQKLQGEQIQTDMLVKQAEFVQKMVNMRLMPDVNGQRVTYRPMSKEEIENPKIELPLGFRPPNAVVKKVNGYGVK